MLRRKETKTAALVLSLAVMLVFLLCKLLGWDMTAWGITANSSWPHRLIYHFAHASLIHAGLNVWCLLSIVFTFDVPLSYLLWAYALASSCPCLIMEGQPIIGLSGICFALLGLVSWQAHKLRYHLWIIIFIALGFATTLLFHLAIANLLHAYCYVTGVAVGFLNSPAPWQK